MAACPNCGSENAEGAKFCSECGTRFAAAEPAARESRKTVTVLFCDVTGSTALGERLDPETLRSVMGRYFEAMSSVLESHGGTVEKFIGDAVMAVFGIPLVHEDDALRAVRAAAEMRGALSDLNAELERGWSVSIQVRIGVNTGPVVAGDPASGQTLVTGDTVNTAARLEQAAAPGEILIGEATAHLVRDAVEVGPVDPLALKGKAEAVGAYRLLEVRAGVAGHERRLDSPMVGRERPLRMLADAFGATASDAACHLFTIFGAAGIGKSRLVREFVSSVGAGVEVLSGRCLSYGDGIAFWPVTEMAIQAAGIADDDDPERARAAINGLFADLPDGELVAAHLTGLMGLAGDGPVEAAWALRRFLEAIASRRPVVAIFDDIHWAEPPLLDAIEHVADRSRDVPILLLCMARPEFLDDRAGWGGGMRNATSAHLEPLSEAESDALIENLLGIPALTADIRERIRGAAQGNPLFVEEVLAMLLDDGILVNKGDEWTATVDLTTVDVPPAISALLAARLDRLSPDERTVLETASVIGEVFERSTLTPLVGDGQRPRVDRLLGSLLRKDLIRESRSDLGADEAYRFRHILLRDAAYEAIPKAERSRLHEAFAESLSASLGDRAAEFDEFIGYHLEQATTLRRELGLQDERTEELARAAFERLRAAGERAFGRGDLAASAALLMHADGILRADDARRLSIVHQLGESLVEIGAFETARGTMRELADLATAADDDLAAMIASAIVDESSFFLGDAPVAKLEEDGLRMLERYERSGDPFALAVAWRYRTMYRWVIEDFGGVIEASGRSAAYARGAGHGSIEREMRAFAQGSGAIGPIPCDDALEAAEELVREGRRRGDRRIECEALRSVAMMLGLLGRLDEGRRLATEAREMTLDLGLRVIQLASAQGEAKLAELDGELEVAAAALRDSCEQLLDLGETAFLSTNAAQLAQLEVERGDLAAAERWIDVAATVGAPDDHGTQVAVKMARGRLAVERGDDAAAERDLRQAVEMTATYGSFGERVESRLVLAAFLGKLGRDEARGIAEDALEIARAKRAAVYERRALELLDSLEP